ncbi:hypothetical protein [Nocardioides sp.]|uniref:hypothetical protein n=1 Tax=Nocardioides sp. TaxID=35761 RepID=UPI003562CD57
MNTHSLRAALVAVVAATALLAPAVSAHAQTQTLRDGAGDTWEQKYDEETDSGSWEATGTQPDVDVVKQVVQHSKKAVTITTVYRELDLSSDFLYLMSQLRTNKASYFATVSRTADGAREVTLGTKGRPVRCRGLDLTISKQTDRLTVVVPRSCLKDPKTVQLRSVAYAATHDPADPENFESYHIYEDAIGKPGHGIGVWTKKLRVG